MSLPAFSGLLARRTAASMAAPEEIPMNMPSSLAQRRAMAMAASLATCRRTGQE